MIVEELALERKVSKEEAKEYVAKKSSAEKQALKETKQKQEKMKGAANLGAEVQLSEDQVSTVYAWGDNRHGQLGINNFIPKVSRPYVFTEKLSIAKIECGADHTLCLTKGGRVYLWGTYYMNARKGERYAPTGSAKTPKLIASLADKVIIDIAAGGGHNLAISEDHTPYSWGAGMDG